MKLERETETERDRQKERERENERMRERERESEREREFIYESFVTGSLPSWPILSFGKRKKISVCWKPERKQQNVRAKKKCTE